MKRRYVVFFLSLVLALALAIPALGGPTNPIAAISASVKSTANKALKKAKAAQKTAEAAQSSANSAQKEAKTAQSAATSAQNEAKAAQKTANEAKTAAANAQATANSKFGQTEFVAGEASGPETTLGLSLAKCPSGSSITGGGYSTSGGGNNEVVPVYTGAYGNAWLADLERIPTGSETWEVTALATCAKP
jgi:membrane protein involved in colicin uptake